MTNKLARRLNNSLSLSQHLSVAGLVASLLVPGAALAIQGVDSYEYRQGAREHRIATPAKQARLDQSPAWRHFRDLYGGGWDVLWDEATGTPVRFWGAGIPAPVAEGEDALWSWAEQFLATHSDLLGQGIRPADLVRGTFDERAGITTLTFKRQFEGLRVVDALVSLRFKAGRMVVGQLESYPSIRLNPTPSLSEDQASTKALTALGWSDKQATLRSAPELVVLPVAASSSMTAHLVWQVDLKASHTPSNRSVFIDANSGELRGWRENNRFINGTVLAEIDDRYPLAGQTDVPLSYVELFTDEDEDTADGQGLFDLEVGEAGSRVEWSLGSDVWRVNNEHSEGEVEFVDRLEEEGQVLVSSPDDDLGNGATRRVRAQLDIHVSGHIARQRAVDIHPGFPWAQQRAVANVNIPTNNQTPGCNAWFDQDSHVNFLRQGAGCNNTGRIADVMYHEYGHGFHGWNIIPGAGAFDGALSEGLADYLSATITGDPGMGRNFFLGSPQPLRDVAPDLVWPEDIAEDPHTTGLIVAGALWDLRELLIDNLGEDAGVAQTDYIMWQIASRASDIETSYVEALLADDDNGNLDDSTPNQCAIDEAFGRHGLGPGAGSDTAASYFVEHLRGDVEQPAFEQLLIEVDAGLRNPDCAEGSLSEVVLRYSFDGSEDLSDWSSLAMDEAGTGAGSSSAVYEASIPGAASGSLLRYRFEALDEDGDVVAVQPIGSRTDPYYATWIGPRDVLWASDFEEDDAGFTSELLSGPDNEGANDWLWGPPGGRAGDPAEAASGNNIWGNDISPAENWNGAYQPEIHNVLRSPAIDVAGAGDVHVQFNRWLTVEDGMFDQATLLVNGSEVWTQFASMSGDGDLHHEDYRWAFRSYDVTNLIGDDQTLEIEWHLESDGGLEMGGWNLDDVTVVASIEVEAPADDLDVDGGLSASGCACSAASTATSQAAQLAMLLAIALGGLGLTRRRRD